jgi:hypothetical protein
MGENGGWENYEYYKSCLDEAPVLMKTEAKNKRYIERAFGPR